jgi:hypothetical protein
MVKPIKFEDWSQRFARHRAQKAVQKLNEKETSLDFSDPEHPNRVIITIHFK